MQSAVVPNVDPALERIVMQAIALDPAARPASAAAIAAALPDIGTRRFGELPPVAGIQKTSPRWWLIGGALLAVAGLAMVFARQKVLTGWLVLLSFHLHLLGDIIGARGPDGYQWPIPYLLPFSGWLQLTWGGQWALNGWPNMVITAGLIALAMVLAWRRGYSPLGIFSERADRVFVETLRARGPKGVERNAGPDHLNSMIG